MVQLQPLTQPDRIYPDSDGRPMADNTKQFEWIVLIKKNLDWLLMEQPNVFVAGDLLWYPVEGNPKIRTAPDVLVVFGRPKGDRGSYKQWEEDGIPPQVVFEILSPNNTQIEMGKKLLFYDRYGVEEYYLYDPDTNQLGGWLRVEGYLEAIEPIAKWVSPRLGIQFDDEQAPLQIYRPDGQPFLTYVEVAQRLEQEREEKEQALQQLAIVQEKSDRMAQRLRELGIDPEQI
ncbi:Uma2 family endonuclease [Leptodesmis sichuanensis]|uniref:Uma2 family endonuclease n=1 Tax=Leptodesmis sichuanensis TaxID=2906798 RepID=UPI001F170FCC|nr:Uma2 family endonuclease [Leptodesmis sichuanensis]UIE39623.1 Uma2 family endonuclease [Leptodesmis sichuanensis A121]